MKYYVKRAEPHRRTSPYFASPEFNTQNLDRDYVFDSEDLARKFCELLNKIVDLENRLEDVEQKTNNSWG